MQQVTRDDIVVSVLMPTYNQAAYIEQAVRSVCAQQTPFRYEVLVSDDASTDGTADCLRALEREITPPIYRFFIRLRISSVRA